MPLYEHDCTRCEFQGTLAGMDWYICPHPDVEALDR